MFINHMIKMICYIPSLFSKAVNYFHFIPSHVRRSVTATTPIKQVAKLYSTDLLYLYYYIVIIQLKVRILNE